MLQNEFFPESAMPDRWLRGDLSEAETIRRLIAVGDSLVRVCDAVDQSVAGNYIAMALDILRADADLKAEMGRIS
ncbi:hypothetical protein [Sphingomonas sp. ERG5]|uniref:hypothetical protein n=1 Tax=Sphingomonas sp. ERG5 TaxID=1381597 RepID=UPI00054BFBF4|nr:hypothetical protein [Sphingomonas sp. ERG5]